MTSFRGENTSDDCSEEDPDTSKRTVLYLLARTERLLRSMQDEVLEPFELNATDYAILARLRDSGSHSTSELSSRLRLTSQAIGQAVSRLEHRGLVDREPSLQDRRKFMLSLSGDGRELMSRCTKAQTPVQQILVSGLTDREIQIVSLLLEKVMTNLNYALGLHE